MTLTASVGRGGRNVPDDVRQVQSRLNTHGAAPTLVVDGACGPATIAAIRWFQEKVVRLAKTDGRVVPGSYTWMTLSRPVVTPEQLQQLRERHVDPRVKENAATTRILEALLPFMEGTELRIVSGWLSAADLAWKVNYHWELLLWLVERSLALPIDQRVKGKLGTIRMALLAHAPDPPGGYRTSGVVGQPVDVLNARAADERYRVLSAQKRSFAGMLDTTDLIARSGEPEAMFRLAAATVARPSASKHATGYAIDIEGPTDAVAAMCEPLGATVVYDERSHTHVEFARGIG